MVPKIRPRCRSLWLVLFSVLFVAACGGDGRSGGAQGANLPAPQPYAYQVPVNTNDGWPVGHLADHRIDVDLLQSMLEGIVSGDIVGIDSVSIARNGTLVLNENFRDSLDQFDRSVGNIRFDRHVMHSTSKSFTSALIGIAVDQGYISGADALFFDLFTYVSYQNWDERKSAMTLEDALTMRLGFVWDEWSIPYGQAGNSLTDLTGQYSDYAKALLDLPLRSDPGATFVYNTAGTVSIGQALENAVGVPMADFAELHLFAPLQIVDARWSTTPTGLPNGGSGLFLTTREMLKFGQLFVNGGTWNGERIISSEWIAQSISRHNQLSWNNTSGYGYQWWVDRFSINGEQIDSYSTRGYGGQYIFCVPALNLVVAFTGRNYGTGAASRAFDLMRQAILPAML